MLDHFREKNIKVLAFDQGGIYIGVDYDKTVAAFQKLGATNARDLYSQANQTDVIDAFERNEVSDKTFYQYLRVQLNGLHENVTNRDLYDTWNAMLTGVIPGVLEFIQTLREAGYITIVVSNADSIHQEGVETQLVEDGYMEWFQDYSFDAKYISSQIGFNKPYVDIFHHVAKELQNIFPERNIQPQEILFVDDSKKHIYGRNNLKTEGAVNAGWNGLLVPSNLPVDKFKEIILTRLS